jgi:hypothetical protein
MSGQLKTNDIIISIVLRIMLCLNGIHFYG